MGEFGKGDDGDPIARDPDGIPKDDGVNAGNGLNLQAGYLFPTGWEIAGRCSQMQIDAQQPADLLEERYTLGISKDHVGNKLKVESDFKYSKESEAADGLNFRLQLELHF